MNTRLPRKVVFPLVAAALATVLPYLLAEGIHAVAMGPQAEVSLAYAFYRDRLAAPEVVEADPAEASSRMITRLDEIEPLLALMQENGVGLGNSPFSGLKTEATSINSDLGPCRVQKPGLRKTVGFLRTNLFNPFDQMTFFHDANRRLPPALEAFLDRYAFRRVAHSTNEHGERLTFPVVEARPKVLVAGDSVANGSMLDDHETLASRLQARDRGRRFVNLGIAGAKAADTVCALERAAERYRGDIDELVYMLCENDWSASEAYGRPDELVTWLEAFRKREAIRRVTIVYVPYIYNTAPELTRLRGHLHHDFPRYRDEKRRLLELARAAGFPVVDFLEVTDRERDRRGTQFATLALYVDHSHPSPLGVKRLLPRILEGDGERAGDGASRRRRAPR